MMTLQSPCQFCRAQSFASRLRYFCGIRLSSAFVGAYAPFWPASMPGPVPPANQAFITRGYQCGRSLAFVNAPSPRYGLDSPAKIGAMDLSELVIEDVEAGSFRVHRSVMTSSDIFKLEQALIFDRSWLYVGHESEVARPGDFCRRMVAGRPLFMIHGRDGKVRIFV